MNDATIFALVGILGSVITALFKLLNTNTKALDRNTIAMESVAKSNKRIADESKQRNGHLAEITMEARNTVLDRIDGVIINKQTVHNQIVEHETVKKKEGE